MEPNGFQGQMPQQPQAPAQQPQAPQQPQVNQQPVQPQPTPQFNILPANPNGPTVQQQPPQQPAQTNQQAAEIAQLRQQIASGLGVQVDQVPSDISTLAKIVQGGWYAAQKMEQLQKQPQPAQPVQPQQTPGQQSQDRLTPKEMIPGWERMVQRGEDGTYKPVHPNFASVAADANYNEGVYAARSMAVNQGQFLPEQQRSVKEMVAQELAREREELKASMFMEANESKLFVMNPDGTRKMEVQPDGSLQPARTEVGLEMIKAAQEVLQEGAQFASQHDLAKYALKVAESRIRMKQQQSQQQEQPQHAQPANNDLAALLNSHRQSGNAGGGNINTLPAQATNDLRTNMRAILRGAPANANGMDYLNFLRGR